MKLSILNSRLPAVILFILVAGISSCKKDAAPPPPPPPDLDTLGAGWQKITSPATVGGFTDVFFVNNNVGWLSGRYLYKSTDGGLTWNRQPVLNDTSSYSNLFFIDELHGFAVGKFLYRTKNGGSSWEEIKINGVDPFFYYDVQFLNHRLGYLGARDGLYRSLDSGTTWTKIPTVNGMSPSLSFIDSARGWVFNGNKPAYTSNAGVNFANSNAYNGQSYFLMQFVDPTTGWVAGGGGAWRTTDAGATWSPVVQGHGADIHFFNQNDGYISHRNEVYRTTNGGQTLTRVAKIGATQGFVEIHFTDPNHGWAASWDNYILRYAQ
jgi:photosystem II stability/assembly factor-like uncharacterized protein